MKHVQANDKNVECQTNKLVLQKDDQKYSLTILFCR